MFKRMGEILDMMEERPDMAFLGMAIGMTMAISLIVLVLVMT